MPLEWKFQISDQILQGRMPMIMGILNLTPDSFFDQGRFAQKEQALIQAEKMLNQGALILDLGGESTRPGAPEVSLQEEMDRVLPVIEALKQNFSGRNYFLSLDTTKSKLAQAGLDLGVHIINDISALTMDAEMFETVAQARCSVILNHMQGRPRTMQSNPSYADVKSEVKGELWHMAQRLEERGLSSAQICLDPGIGFGKNLDHNLELLRTMKELGGLRYPILMGTSRKSLFARIPGLENSDRLMPSVASALWAAEQGVAVVRVHDVLATAEALRTWEVLKFGVEYV